MSYLATFGHSIHLHFPGAADELGDDHRVFLEKVRILVKLKTVKYWLQCSSQVGDVQETAENNSLRPHTILCQVFKTLTTSHLSL